MIRFDHVTKMLGGRAVLDDVSFAVRRGELFAVAGSSGMGKTVTLKLIARLMSPTSGSIKIGDTCISEADAEGVAAIRARMGYLFQSGALLEWITVAENVALPLRETTGMVPAEIETRVQEMLTLVGLEKDCDKYPAEISGGMRKRAGLARALIRRPEIVLFDEPTSGLDPVMARQIDHLIRKLTGELGMTGIVVTHDLRAALDFASRIALLSNGRFVEMATPAAFARSAVPEVRQFLAAQFIQ